MAGWESSSWKGKNHRERRPTEWRKDFASDSYDEVLVSRLYITLVKLNKNSTEIWNWKNAKTIPGMRGWEMKENDGGDEFNYDTV
jgi:hypothetical protein